MQGTDVRISILTSAWKQKGSYQIRFYVFVFAYHIEHTVHCILH